MGLSPGLYTDVELDNKWCICVSIECSVGMKQNLRSVSIWFITQKGMSDQTEIKFVVSYQFKFRFTGPYTSRLAHVLGIGHRSMSAHGSSMLYHDADTATKSKELSNVLDQKSQCDHQSYCTETLEFRLCRGHTR